MAITERDYRAVNITVTRQELAQLLGQKAKQAGLIDFDPDRTEVHDNGDSFTIVFEVDSPILPQV